MSLGEKIREMTPKNRQYVVAVVIVFFWIRAFYLNTFLQSETADLAGSASSLFRSATFYGAINLAILFGLWYWSGGTLKGLGWQKKGFGKHLGIGCLFGLAMVLQHYLLTGPLISRWVPTTTNPGVDMANLFSDISDLPLWILLALFKGGFEEELWRSFEINAFQRIGGKTGLILALILGSVFFGLQHSYQGWDTVVSTGFDGLLYGLIYLRRRSVIEAMSAHALFDIISISAGYLLM